jgi:NDP-sugar pyrophosphorylase family protein
VRPPDAVVMLLAGGRGERLHPLTRDRTKPAVPFAGIYRIIDFTLSNCVNSGLRHIVVLTQYKSESLDRHLRVGWNVFNPEVGEYIDTVPPQQRFVDRWYEGTADAIFQNLHILNRERSDRVLILSGDHVYKMDYRAMLSAHAEAGAALTIATFEIPIDTANQFGVLEVDEQGLVIGFHEKPENPEPAPGRPGMVLANMGVYVFDTEALVRSVVEDSRRDSAHDFGMNIIPALVESGARVQSYPLRQPLRQAGRLLARRRDHRRLLRGPHGPHPAGSADHPARPRLAAAHLAAPVPARVHRTRPRRQRRGGRGLPRRRRRRDPRRQRHPIRPLARRQRAQRRRRRGVHPAGRRQRGPWRRRQARRHRQAGPHPRRLRSRRRSRAGPPDVLRLPSGLVTVEKLAVLG